MAKTIKDLDLKVNDLKTFFSGEINRFRNEIEKVKTPTTEEKSGDERISEISNNFDLFSASVNNRLKELELQIDALRKNADACLAQIDKNFQYNNRGKILLLGLKESPGEDLLGVVIDLFNSKLRTSIKKCDIFYTYRLGKKNDKKVRPAVVEFGNMWTRNEVFACKKLLKGTGIIIADFLSPIRYEVFKLVKQKLGKECWTNKGMIGFKIGDEVKYVTTVRQFQSAIGSVGLNHPPVVAGPATDGASGTAHGSTIAAELGLVR